MIYVCVLVTTLAAAVSSFLATPVYKSTTRVLIERHGVRLLKQDLGSSEPSWLDYTNFYNTQYQIIASDAVLRDAIDRLKLLESDDETASGQPPSKFSKALAELKRFITRSQVPLDEHQDPYKAWLMQLRGGLAVTPVRESHLVDVSFTHKNREFAAEVANAVAQGYINFTLGNKAALAAQASGFFDTQIQTLRTEIRELQAALNEYAQSHGIVQGDTTDAALQALKDLGSSKTLQETELASRRARLQALSTASPESIEEVRNSPLVSSLRSEIAELDRQLSQLTAVYGDEERQVKETRAKLATARANLESTIRSIAQRAIDAARVDYSEQLKEVAELERLYNDAVTRVGQFKADQIEYLQNKAVIDQKNSSLSDMLQKQSEVQQAGSLGDTAHNVRVVDVAVPSDVIAWPKKKLNTLLGLMIGLFLGVGAAVLLEYIDNTLKTPDDVRNVLGAAVLGMIPAQDLDRKRSAEREAEAPNVIDPALITSQQPLSPISEAYRELRTAVLLATPGHPPRDLCVTSCQPSEGKTTTVINLAITLTQLGRRVLLVDTDLRRPRCHHVLRVSSNRGVSTFLTGTSDLTGLVQPTSIERLSVIAAGPIPPNPAELLDSERFREFVLALRARTEFDHIVFDSPPVLSVVDPLLIGRHTDGTIMVLKSAFTSREAGRLGKEKLSGGRLNLLGTVLNAVQTEHVPYQYRYYRYGYSQTDGSDSEGTGPRTVSSGKR